MRALCGNFTRDVEGRVDRGDFKALRDFDRGIVFEHKCGVAVPSIHDLAENHVRIFLKNDIAARPAVDAAACNIAAVRQVGFGVGGGRAAVVYNFCAFGLAVAAD